MDTCSSYSVASEYCYSEYLIGDMETFKTNILMIIPLAEECSLHECNFY